MKINVLDRLFQVSATEYNRGEQLMSRDDFTQAANRIELELYKSIEEKLAYIAYEIHYPNRLYSSILRFYSEIKNKLKEAIDEN